MRHSSAKRQAGNSAVKMNVSLLHFPSSYRTNNLGG